MCSTAYKPPKLIFIDIVAERLQLPGARLNTMMAQNPARYRTSTCAKTPCLVRHV